MALLTTIGLMSGTSMDGIDVALLRTDGEAIVEFGPSLSRDFDVATRKAIAASLEDAKAIASREERPGNLDRVERIVTDLHADAVKQFLDEHSMKAEDVDLIGFHGQTVLHRPDEQLTVQLGDGQRLADACGIDVVFDLRAKDMTVGGQGAPLVPVFHAALAHGVELEGPLAFVNIGGISNVTYVGNNGELIAFDSGPGNALIDQWLQQEAGLPYDQGGKIASEGGVQNVILKRYLSAPFFDQSVPKSLDRADFEPLDAGVAELSDGARTLARLTAEAIILSQKHFPEPPKNWIICGGGRLNSTIIADLEELTEQDDAQVRPAEAIGLDGDMLEAQAFGYLAARSVKDLPLTFPGTTGCSKLVSGGVLARASR